MTTILRPPASPLDSPPTRFRSEPFFAKTVTLWRSVRDHDFDSLAQLCDDDFGIVDVDPSASARPIRSRAAWEDWFHELFATRTAMGAVTDSEILDHRAIGAPDLGYSVLDFRQTLTVGEWRTVASHQAPPPPPPGPSTPDGVQVRVSVPATRSALSPRPAERW